MEDYNSSGEDNDTDDSTSHIHMVNTRARNTMDLGLASTMDRTKVSDRNVTFIIAATESRESSWGHNLQSVIDSPFQKKIQEGNCKKFNREIQNKCSFSSSLGWKGAM